MACGERLDCVSRLPGGYCASVCGVGHGACDGACVDTRDGELCAKGCTTDRDCRVDEGYLCDREWHACLVPNFAAVVPRQCPAKGTPRDISFADSTQLTGTVGGLGQRSPSIVLGDAGELLAAYTIATPDGGAVLGTARRESASAPANETPFVPGDALQLDAQLARDRKGTVFAVWHGIGESGHEIDLATSADRGATWSTRVPVHDPSDCSEADRVCVDRPLIVVGKDALHVLYAAGTNGLRVRTSRDGGKTFTTGALAVTGTAGTALATSDGKLHVVAMTGGPLGAYGSAQQAIHYAASVDGGATFSAPVRVSGTDETLPYYFSNPALAADSARKWLYVAYARGGRDAAWDIVLAASKDGGVTWKRTKLAGDGCAIHMVPNLAVDPTTGRLHIAYYDSEGAAGRFVHASCGPGATKCAIAGAINSVPFATLSTARNSSKWVGDSEAIVVDAKRRVLHAVWAQPVDESGKPVARIFHATAKLSKR